MRFRCALAVRLCAALAVSTLVGLACEAEPQAPASAYQVRVVGWSGSDQSSGALVRAAVSDALDTTRWLSSPAGSGPVLDADVRYVRLNGVAGGSALRVELGLRTPAALRVELGRELAAVVEVSRVDGTILLSRDLPEAIGRAITIVDARMTLSRGDKADRIALLASEDPQLALLALDWAEAHRARGLADAVARLAESPRDAVALRAIECIGVIGGPEHARWLVRHPRVGDRAHANRLYDALANLGGAHASGFLEFAARNEEDPELASTARHALTRLREYATQSRGLGKAQRSPWYHRLAGEDA